VAIWPNWPSVGISELPAGGIAGDSDGAGEDPGLAEAEGPGVGVGLGPGEAGAEGPGLADAAGGADALPLGAGEPLGAG